MYNKWRIFRKHEFQRENSLKISDKKKERKQNSRPFQEHPVEHTAPKTTRFSDNSCAIDKIISLGPKRSIEIFIKKGYLPREKKFSLQPFFSSYRVKKTSCNILLRSRRSSENFCQNCKFICVWLKRSIETNIPKEGYIPVTKDFRLFFLKLWSVTNLKEQFSRFFKVFWHCGSYRIISSGPKMLLKTYFFEKKRLSLQWRKKLGLFFLVLLSVPNITKRFIRVHKVIWHLLWKL